MSFAHRGRILYKLFQLMGTSTKWYIKLTVRLMPWVDRFKCTLHNGNFVPVGFKVVQNFTTAMSLSLFGRTLNSVLNSKSSSNLLRHKFKTFNKYKRNSVLHKLTLKVMNEIKHCKNYRSDLKCFSAYSAPEPKLYYMANSVFAMRLVNLRSVSCYTDQTFRFKESYYKTSVNLEDLDPFDFVLQRFDLCIFVKADEETESLSYRKRGF